MLPNHRKKKTTPIACNNRARGVDNESSAGFMPSFSYCFLTSNGIGAICRAYARGDKYMIAFILFLYVSFLLLELCFKAYQRLPPHEESRKKHFLKIGIWGLTTAIFFGLLYQFAPYFCLAAALSAYAVAIASSACIFYVYFIFDDKNGNCSCCSDQKIKSSQYSIPVEEASDKKLELSISILDKV